jgi:anti-anti-sigma factor
VSQPTIVTEHVNADAVLRVAGALDLRGGDLLEEAVRPLIGSVARLVLDLSEVHFIDSSGLGALIALQQQTSDTGSELSLRAPSDAVRRVLDITQTTPVFEVDPAG